MDRSSFYRKRLAQDIRTRGSVWSAIASVLFFTGYASSLGNEHHVWQGRATDRRAAGLSVAPKSARLSFRSTIQAEAARPIFVSAPAIDSERLAARFAGSRPGSSHPLPFSVDGLTFPVSHPVSRLLDPSDDEGVKYRRAAYSPIGVFSLGEAPAKTGPEAKLGTPQQPHPVLPRSDLLDGVPKAYAALAVRIAAEEEVDPNWVLAIMRAENVGFDRQLAGPAGAIGLMQVMPQIGTAFGASDLTDPEQNIRAGTRFLHLLIGKYRNPVLIASAYNAGEPRVDASHSLPLIQETADYVTRVVGYYTGMTATFPAAHAAVRPQAGISPVARKGTAERAKSPMLVFSAAEPSAALGPARQQPAPIVVGGPVKIVKEEAVQ
ncbi:transglycosylase SLT domain-containing protein (plasmid) [Aliirhizobium terrae]|uniref:lytic transglycosylase domain-containing protein n=1 Tax=Terrirhizobium terrae TaxID=2926709 RepID=UPI00257608B4|nr:transglycosylase SLT domain-containing protein [Rhizobium sp. CC-CFT758]WJH38574.1 transglycosylase SLT domain-containing protein [Rhizobium sp. CC-CFT758]